VASRGHSGWVAAAAFFDDNCRHALTLRAWEAVSTERHLQGVLEAVTEVLLPVVSFKWLGIVWFDGVDHDLYALHGVDYPRREGETLEEFLARPEIAAPREIPVKPLVPYSCDPGPTENGRATYTCADLFEKEGWLEHEFHLAGGGIRAYASIPLRVRDELIGAAVFSRTEPVGFTDEQVALLEDVSRALAVAVSNAIANEEIRKLRTQLEAENVALRIELGRAPWFDEIVGDSPVLRRVLEDVEQVASTDATVLITGETGTGKELIARALHRRSPRAEGPLVKVNCAAIPETLLASELFGHERGAFTGATERRKGRFEQADGGTLFLDEVGEMSPEAQVMLLRVLQERELERLGGNDVVPVDVRVVAATNRDLEELVRAGRFRSDLYYRLSVFPIRMPPLRERARDIPLLVAHFAAKHGKRFGRAVTGIDVRTLDALGAHDWPGNVRELENLVERSVILSRDGTLTLERGAPATSATGPLAEDLRARERGAIEEALRATRGRVSGPNGAAKRLGLPPSTLEFRIRRLGIDKYRYRTANSQG
jgi:formate hydrogenlyase transcriptional activator